MKPLVSEVVISSMMKTILILAITLVGVFPAMAKGPSIADIGASSQQIGASGVMWYTTWQTALAEAKRSNRPIFFMSAAAQCSGISGVF